MAKFIKVESEWDICGQFGGNHNQDIFTVPDDANIDALMEERFEHLLDTGYTYEEMKTHGLLVWEYITIEGLK